MSNFFFFFRIFVTVLSGGVVLTACSFYQPTLPESPDDLPRQYLETLPSVPTTPLPELWWESFDDPRLNALMGELFAQNLELVQAFARLEQARAVARISSGARWPQLNLEAERGRSKQPSFAGSFTGNNEQYAAAASFEIDLWGKLANRADAAGREAAAGYLDVQTLYLGLSAQLADFYYFAVEERAQLALTDRTISSFQETLELVERRYRQGLVPAVDVYQARQNLAAAKAVRPVFESNLAATEHAIAVLIGRYPDRESAGDLVILPEMVEAFPAGLPAELMTRRPDLQAAYQRVAAADSRVAAAIADRFPAINLLGNIGHSRQDFATGLIKGDFWSLLGQLAVPVVDGGARRAEVDRTRAALGEAVASYQQALLQAFQEVEDALVANRTSEDIIDGLIETQEATGSSLRLALQRYSFGVTDYLPVLTAQRSHFLAQRELLSARRQLVSNRITLAPALGGNWMADFLEQRLTARKVDTL